MTSVDVTDAFAMLPTALFMSRHELSLFRWSIPSSLHLLFIVGGDVCMSNAALPPPLGAGGALALGGGLWLAGVMPTAGFALNATAWLLHATCHVALSGYAPPQAQLKSRFALVEVKAAGFKSSAAKLQLRVGGYRRPRFWSFDDAAKYAPSPPNEHASPLALSPSRPLAHITHTTRRAPSASLALSPAQVGAEGRCALRPAHGEARLDLVGG